MENTIQAIKDTINYLKKSGIDNTDAGIILGTGLGNFIEEIDIEKEIPYSEIPHFPLSTVEFHSGKLIYGNVSGKKILAMNGRFHFYEGYNMQQITYPVRIMQALGTKNLFISNAAGAMNLQWKKGDLMLVCDHINLLPSNPLIGKNEDSLGTRFPDMSKAYCPYLRSLIKKIARENDIILREGIYAAVQGPMLETPAEYRFLRKIGADAVGMSTVPEVIAAVHAQISVAAISVLTDECDPDNLQPINIPEIIQIAGKAEKKLSLIFKKAIELC